MPDEDFLPITPEEIPATLTPTTEIEIQLSFLHTFEPGAVEWMQTQSKEVVGDVFRELVEEVGAMLNDIIKERQVRERHEPNYI